MKISVIVPAYNEEGRIRETLSTYLAYFSGHANEIEFVVMVEGTDRTTDVVREFCQTHDNIKYEYSSKRLGKGGAIIRGFSVATGDLIGYVDADASTKPAAFDELIKNISGCDGIIASRKLRNATLVKKEPFLQRVGSRGFNLLARAMFGLPFRDTQCGAKLFTREAICAVLPELGITEFAFDVDLLFRLTKKGFMIRELPTTWEHKAGAKFNFAKSFWKLIPNMFLSLCRLRLLYSPFRAVVRAYDLTIGKLKHRR
jgi:glycosyltransferase involved in cell wall biosynthesis